MKNKQKFAKEILDVAWNGSKIAMIHENHPICCDDIYCCDDCLFYKSDEDCRPFIKEWMESEYIEKPTITSKEKAFLDLLLPKWKYLARDEDEKLYAFDLKPSKSEVSWYIKKASICSYYNISENLFGSMFDFIKWEDEKPWSIEKLKKLEVEDE